MIISFEGIEWKAISEHFNPSHLLGDDVIFTPLIGGLEAEVYQVETASDHYVLKIWNLGSRPDVSIQYTVLNLLRGHGLSVSVPFAWGVDGEQNQVLLTSYDGEPIQKLSTQVMKQLAQQLTAIHSLNVHELHELSIPRYDFIYYFFPEIDRYEEVKSLLLELIDDVKLSPTNIIHGDFNLGNILRKDDNYTIIDWTNVQLGDPRYDIAWSSVLLNIYTSPTYYDAFRTVFIEQYQYSLEEQKKFESIALLRLLLLNRVVTIPIQSDTVKKIRQMIKMSNLSSHSFVLELLE